MLVEIDISLNSSTFISLDISISIVCVFFSVLFCFFKYFFFALRLLLFYFVLPLFVISFFIIFFWVWFFLGCFRFLVHQAVTDPSFTLPNLLILNFVSFMSNSNRFSSFFSLLTLSPNVFAYLMLLQGKILWHAMIPNATLTIERSRGIPISTIAAFRANSNTLVAWFAFVDTSVTIFR